MKNSALTIGIILTAAALSGTGYAAAVDHLVHQWTFNDGTGNDSVGSAHGRLNGNAAIGNGALHLARGDINFNTNCMITSGLGGTLRDKTLIAWCALSDLDRDGTCAGAVLSITADNTNSSRFDGIVFGERVARQWMSGSDWWRRTPESNGGAEEDIPGPGEVMIAITYQSDPVQITLYRNGVFYARHNQANDYGIPEFDGNAVAIFGPRNATEGYISGHINEARIYDTALTAEEIAAIYAEGPVPSDVTGIWNGGFEAFSPWAAITEEKEAGGMNLIPAGWYLPREIANGFLNGMTSSWNIYLASRWYYPDPTEGATRLCIEADWNWTMGMKLWVTTAPLGNMKAGEVYRIDADFQTSSEDRGHTTYPRMELIDLTAGDILAVTEEQLASLHGKRLVDETVSLSLVSPSVSADRAGHQLALRVMSSLFGIEYINDWHSIRLGVDNVRLTVADPGDAAVSDATWINEAGGIFSDTANWQNGVLPAGTDRTVTFNARAVNGSASITLDRAVQAATFDFQTGPERQVWEVNETTNGSITVNATIGQPTIHVGSGLAALSSLYAPKGFVKTGAGTLQIGEIRQLAGPIDIREGRVSISDVLRHRWSFNGGNTEDLIGMAHGTLSNARVEDDQLVIPSQGASFMTDEIMRPIDRKTMMVWVTLSNPAVSTKGSALTLFNGLGTWCTFDGIVYGECRDACWMSGSDNWHRTQYPQGFGEPETSTEEVFIAISYYSSRFADFHANIFRDGILYGDYGQWGYGVQLFAKDSRIMIGPRHYGCGDTFIGKINEARIYRVPVSMEQLAELAAIGPNKASAVGKVPPLPKDLAVTMSAGGIFDLNMTEQTIASLSGAGRVQNGNLHVSDALTVTGPLTFDNDFALAENTVLTLTSFDSCLAVESGSLTFPANGTVVFEMDHGSVPPKEGFVIFKNAVATDWDQALSGLDMEAPTFSRYQTSVVKTETTYGYAFRFIGGTVMLVQ
ncbi:MAG: hypothetical protein J6336_11950 [Kiritimatiellae bacterium]|nr:hypothetical protein [Kiritimatiellia bacterium]